MSSCRLVDAANRIEAMGEQGLLVRRADPGPCLSFRRHVIEVGTPDLTVEQQSQLGAIDIDAATYVNPVLVEEHTCTTEAGKTTAPKQNDLDELGTG